MLDVLTLHISTQMCVYILAMFVACSGEGHLNHVSIWTR